LNKNTISTTTNAPYIISYKQDRLWIMGGAFISLALIYPLISLPNLVPILFWIWAFFFDGPHIWATYSRTYIDIDSWQHNRKLYLVSLLFLILPLSVVAIDKLYPNYFILFVFFSFAMFWAYHHVVRQHYGFMSLYDRKSNATLNTHTKHKWQLYLGLWIPYFHLGLNHPVNIKLFNFSVLHTNPFISAILFWLPILISLVIITSLIFTLLRHLRNKRAATQTDQFLLICIGTQSIILYAFSSYEPVLINASNSAQYFMGITILLTLFHNIQYLAFVWRYNEKQYVQQPHSGLAKFLNKNIIRFFIAGLAFSSLYVYLEWAMGEYPSLLGHYENNYNNATLIALALWWGFSMHHYYLDQKIWRPSKSKSLKQKIQNL